LAVKKTKTLLFYAVAGAFLFVSTNGGSYEANKPPPKPSRDPAIGVQYYVATTGSNSNPGTQPRPWRTISYAAKRVKPGDTVLVAPGTYRENVLILTGGNANARIEFLSTVKWGARVIGVKHSFPNGALYATVAIYASYIDFVGFDVAAPYSLVGIQMDDGGVPENGSYNRIAGNRVHDVAGGCKLGLCDHRYYPTPNTAGAGILIGSSRYRGHNNDVIENLVFDIGEPLNPFNANLVHGIYIDNGGEFSYSSPASYATKAQNNVIYRIEATGIQEYHCTSNNIVTYNTITDAGVAGIWVAGQAVGGLAKRGCINRDSVVASNIVMHNGWHPGCPPAYHGRCVNEHDAGGGCGIMTSTTSSGGRFVNNLSFGNRCGYKANDTFSIAGQRHTLSGNLVGVDPRFVKYLAGGGGNYHLRADSPAIDHGSSLDAPNTDLDGVRRPQGGGYDIGAYEFVKVTAVQRGTAGVMLRKVADAGQMR
jgi:hypothetical protein